MPRTRLKARLIDPPISRFRLQIRRSPIQGLGVFARETIPGRRLVIEYAGDRISRAEAQRRFLKRGKPKRISFARLNRNWIIDGWKGNGSEYINHSCSPNLYFWKPRGHIFLCSLKRILPGEELSVDYKIRRHVGEIPCHCRAANCRGLINTPAKRHRDRDKRAS